MKIKYLKIAVEKYNRLNKSGKNSPFYGIMMFDKSTGEVWTDKMYNTNKGNWISYPNPDIVNLTDLMTDYYINELKELDFKITEETVKKFITEKFKGYEV